MARLVERYFAERRSERPNTRLLWRMTDTWWRNQAGWTNFRKFKGSHEAKRERSDSLFFRYEVTEPLVLLSRNGGMKPYRHATFQLGRVGVLRKKCPSNAWHHLQRSLWWVLVLHPGCVCASGGAVDALVVHRRGLGYRIFGIG